MSQLIKDVNGDEVSIEELVGRLKFRQHKNRKTGIPVDSELNVLVCWQGHTVLRRIEERKTCGKCKTRWRVEIRAGVLIQNGGM